MKGGNVQTHLIDLFQVGLQLAILFVQLIDAFGNVGRDLLHVRVLRSRHPKHFKFKTYHNIEQKIVYRPEIQIQKK
jgi:hypothetical protein